MRDAANNAGQKTKRDLTITMRDSTTGKNSRKRKETPKSKQHTNS